MGGSGGVVVCVNVGIIVRVGRSDGVAVGVNVGVDCTVTGGLQALRRNAINAKVHVNAFPMFIYASLSSIIQAPNCLAHLPPVMARRLTHCSSISCNLPLNPHADQEAFQAQRREGGQVEPVLGGILIIEPVRILWLRINCQ